MEIRPVLLVECDDILVETRRARIAAVRDAIAPDGATLTDEKYDVACAGLSNTAAVRAAYRAAGIAADETAIELAALRADAALAATLRAGASLAPGAAGFVRGAVGHARLGIVTRLPRRVVSGLLEDAELESCFECVIAAEDHTGTEPSPEPWFAAIDRLVTRAPVRLGDEVALVASLNGVASARAARMHPVVVGEGAPTVAFAGDLFLPTLVGTTAAALVERVLARPLA
jgi:beta-phosphoglucomutase-like phosphatase (HAD superfamily)